MRPYMPLTNDYAFQVTFGNEADTTFARVAIAALIGSDTPIKKLTFDKNAFKGLSPNMRSGILDISCVDEKGRSFVVEMQVQAPGEFFQRQKFYGLYKFNKMVKRGKDSFKNLKKIYCISILGNNINPFDSYHQVITLKNQNGEEVDNQLTYVTIELDKFKLTAEEVKTDLEKLIFTMKNVHTFLADNPLPKFMNEKWIRKALDEVDVRSMSDDDQFHWEKLMVQTVSVMEQRKDEIKKAKKEAKAEGKAEGKAEEYAVALAKQRKTIARFLIDGSLTIPQIAEAMEVSLELVVEIRDELIKDKIILSQEVTSYQISGF